MALDFYSLLNLGDLAVPTAFAASLFSFGKKKTISSADPRHIETIDRCVHEFLENRDIGKFKVFTTLHEQRPIVHVQAEAHKNLRFSNLIEIRIRQYVEEKTGVEIGAVYWRFQIENAEEPALEQASYEDYTAPPHPPQPAAVATTATAKTAAADNAAPPAAPSEHHLEDYDIRRLAKEGIDVQEISQSELDALIGNQGLGKKE